MSLTIKKFLVMRISATNETYYISDRHGGITLDSEDYLHLLVSHSDASKIGNFGEGKQRGKGSAMVMNGEQWHQGNYIFDVTNVFNNRNCVTKLCDPDNDTSWDDCEDYYAGIMKNVTITNESISFDIDDYDFRDDTTLPLKTTEDIINTIPDLDTDDIPDKFKGKRIPMQVGDLTDKDNGIFGKCITLSAKVGNQQIIADYKNLIRMDGVGAWESGIERFFLGRRRSIVNNIVQGEYEINNNKNKAVFSVDTATFLSNAILSTSSGIENIVVNDFARLQWTNEENVDEENLPELLSINIIAIDDELMLLVDKPNATTVWVERGYNNTTPTTHNAFAPIFQSSKFAAKNLLSFNEKFDITGTANNFWGLLNDDSTNNLTNKTPGTIVEAGGFSDLVQGGSDQFVQIGQITTFGAGADEGANNYNNFDLKFGAFEDDFKVSNWFVGIKFDFTFNSPNSNFANFGQGRIDIWPPTVIANFNSRANAGGNTASLIFREDTEFDIVGGTRTLRFDSFSEIIRENQESVGDGWVFQPNQLSVDNTNILSLKDLNGRWKMSVLFAATAFGDSEPARTYDFDFKLYQLGLWADFFLDFSKRVTMSPLQGRIASQSHSLACTGQTTTINGNLINQPLVAIYECLRQIDYGPTDTDRPSWTSIYSYQTNSANYPSSPEQLPETAFSFGIDESSAGWDLAQLIASHFNMTLFKRDNGTVKVVNLHRLQNARGGLPTFQISLDDILNPAGKKMLNIQQTGTNRLRNDVQINYKRNNSTDEFQDFYPVPEDSPDAYVLIESGITLEDARNTYYGGKKTETFVVDSPFIYNKEDARRLWEWHINDKAEIFFWAEFTIDYEHYNKINSKSSQYEIGDLIYLDGIHSGVTFNSSRLWVVREIIKKDQGREFEIHAKSVEPISEFTSNAIGQNETYQDVIDNSPDDTVQDVVDGGQDAIQDKL